jgi:hypothetical protein
MSGNKLKEFINDLVARGRITFGDVRRLQRDYLPNGVSTRQDIEMLIRADSAVSRVDRSWTAWLVAAITDFARREQRDDPVVNEPCLWLDGLLALNGKATKNARRIVREIRRGAQQTAAIIPFPTGTTIAPTVGRTEGCRFVRCRPAYTLFVDWQGTERCLSGGRLPMIAA